MHYFRWQFEGQALVCHFVFLLLVCLFNQQFRFSFSLLFLKVSYRYVCQISLSIPYGASDWVRLQPFGHAAVAAGQEEGEAAAIAVSLTYAALALFIFCFFIARIVTFFIFALLSMLL